MLRRLLNAFQLDGFLLDKLNYFQLIQKFDHLISRVDLVPAYTAKVGARAVLVVIVVIAFTHHQEINRQEVSGRIPYFKISVTILVREPVDYRAMNWAHEEHKGK